jgi:hypothetical protein
MANFIDKFGPLPAGIAGCRQYRGFPGICFGSRRSLCRQVAHSHQVVSCGREGEDPAHPFLSSVPGFPEIADGFDPAEDFHLPFSQALTDGIARMAGSPAVDGRRTRRTLLGQMRHGIKGTQGLDKLPSIISLITLLNDV